MFTPNIQQMSTLIRVQHRVVTNVNGADDISYVPEADINFCNWKGMGGTEVVESGSLVVYDTAQLTMWFDPSITEQDVISPEEILNSWQLKMDKLTEAYNNTLAQYGEGSQETETAQQNINEHLKSKPVYEVVNIENVEQRNMYLILKVKRVVSA